MANESTNNAKKEKFIGLLHELFQLNQPELDFGLYRIMHAKSGQIKAFIKNDLASEIDDAFADSGDDKIAELKAHYEQARAQAVEFGIPDPDSNPKVKEAKEAYDAARDNGDDPSDIYDHLYRFFSRYYDKGDFLSRRYHVGENESRAAPYAVPYDGREVYLHWANKDQYYIKSSEYLSNFSFDLSEAIEKERKRQGAVGQEGLNFGSPHSDTPMKVTLQLVDAAEGAHNNVKENQVRFFIIHADNPVEVRSLTSAEGDGQELIINFEYRPDPEKSGQESGWQKKRLQEAESVILDALEADVSLKPFHEALAFLAPTEKQKDRTLLAKYLTSYTARNTMDYFIHKDLGGFLRRELDFYIKNEIMRLDDLSNDDIVGVTHSLKKITALRSIARQIIDFLAQLENFQKKLWLKKKFVTEVNYCFTLDRVPESFYEEILTNTDQWQEWHKLGFLDKPTPSLEILHDQSFMMLDTGHFDDSFKERLLAEIDDLDEQNDGVLINSENFQCLNFIKTKYRERIDAIYIDPPYNTSASEIIYKNSYKDSSWLSLIDSRVRLSKQLMSKSAIHCLTIDDFEYSRSHLMLDSIFGDEQELGVAVIKSNPSGRSTAKGFSISHEYAIFHSESENTSIGRLSHSSAQLSRYKFKDEIGPYEWVNFRKHGGANANRYARPKLFYPIIIRGEKIIFPEMDWSEENKLWTITQSLNDDDQVIYPVTPDGEEKTWKWGIEKSRDNPQEFCVRKDSTGKAGVYRKARLNLEGTLPLTVWDDKKYSATEYGTNHLKRLFGEGEVFSFPKSINAVKDCLRVANFKSGVVLDYFAGSGTTAAAAIDLNREDGNQRKYVLAEMGMHFDNVLRPRIKKAVYARGWKSGKPMFNDDEEVNGISHSFKYLRLESYEDSLNNLCVSAENGFEKRLWQQENTDLRKRFYLNYFLNVETRGSASLLNVEKFKDPLAYSLIVKGSGSDSQKPINVDLIETFNWLLGLEVTLLDRPRTYRAEFEREKDPELSQDQETRLMVKEFKQDEKGAYWFRIVDGYIKKPGQSRIDGERTLIVWRKLTDNPEKDAAVLETFLKKYNVNQHDSNYSRIYINGPHGLSLSGQAKAKLFSLEETFMARMWEDTEGAMH